MSGQEHLCIAGGVESMSRVPMLSDGGALILDPSVAMAEDIVPQGISADLIATLAGYTREQLDQFAHYSHQKACKAIKQNHLKSVISINHPSGITALDQDEIPRSNSHQRFLA